MSFQLLSSTYNLNEFQHSFQGDHQVKFPQNILFQIYTDTMKSISSLFDGDSYADAGRINASLEAWAKLVYLIHTSEDTPYEEYLNQGLLRFGSDKLEVGTSNCNGTDFTQGTMGQPILHLFYNNGTTVAETDGSVEFIIHVRHYGTEIHSHRFTMRPCEEANTN